MLPRSPPLPFTQRICFVIPSRDAICSRFELVFPPPKFVIRRSEPSKFDRYLSNSGASSFAATASSQRSSRNRSPLCAVMCQPLSYRPKSRPRLSFHTKHQYGNYFQCEKPSPGTIDNRPTSPLLQRLPRHHPMSHIVIRRHRLPLQQRQPQMNQARPIRVRLVRNRPDQRRLVPLHLLNRLSNTILPQNRNMLLALLLPHRIHRSQPARIRRRRNQNMFVLRMPLQKIRDQLLAPVPHPAPINPHKHLHRQVRMPRPNTLERPRNSALHQLPRLP